MTYVSCKITLSYVNLVDQLRVVVISTEYHLQSVEAMLSMGDPVGAYVQCRSTSENSG